MNQKLADDCIFVRFIHNSAHMKVIRSCNLNLGCQQRNPIQNMILDVYTTYDPVKSSDILVLAKDLVLVFTYFLPKDLVSI